jgi:hypothetical protein
MSTNATLRDTFEASAFLREFGFFRNLFLQRLQRLQTLKIHHIIYYLKLSMLKI